MTSRGRVLHTADPLVLHRVDVLSFKRFYVLIGSGGTWPRAGATERNGEPLKIFLNQTGSKGRDARAG